MKLSMSLIAKYMKKYEPECHILEDTMTITGVRFFAEQPDRFLQEYVYLDTANHYFKDPHYADALLLANGQNQVLCRGAEYETLLNDVLAAFDYYNTFEQNLYRAMMQKRSLQEMMEITEQILDVPFFVFDIEGNLLGECHREMNLEGDFSLMRKTKKIGTDMLGQVFENKEGRVIHDLLDIPQLTNIQGQQGMQSISMYLTQDGDRIGFVLMPVKDALEESVGLCLEPMLAEMCAQADEFTEKSSFYQSNHSIFVNLLEDREMEPEVVEKLHTYLHFTSQPVLAAFQSVSIQNLTYQRMICKSFEQANIPGIASQYKECVLFLIPEEKIGELIQLLRQHNVLQQFLLGISMPIQLLEHISTGYQQSLFAMQYTTEPGVRYCRSLALPYLIKNLRETEMSAHLRHPVIALLQEYDQKNKTNLLETLRIYVQNGCRQAETAEKMHIHLNTLKYRIRRIVELSHVDLKDYEELLYIQLSLIL